MIWLFPSKDMPITARNICSCLDVARSYAATEGLPKVRYFSSVPYVLQMMEADGKGLQVLQDLGVRSVASFYRRIEILPPIMTGSIFETTIHEI